MKAKNKNEKLHLSVTKIILIFLGLFIFFDGSFYLSFQWNSLWPLKTSFYVYTSIILVICVTLAILAIKETYYIVDKDKISHYKMKKVTEYYFKDIAYINEEWSRKHKMLLFYDKQGHDHYLAFDKRGVIFDEALKHVNQMSFEEFKARFPNAKF